MKKRPEDAEVSDQTRRAALKKLYAISAAAFASSKGLSPAVANASWDPKPRESSEDIFVIDGVVHCYNHDLSNYRFPARIAEGASYGYDVHARLTPEPFRLSPEQWLHDWQPEETAEQIFLESDTDMMCMHSVPLFSHYKDGLVTNSKGAYLKAKYPDRVFWYAAVDIFDDLDTIYRTIDWVASQGADGLKLYPRRINPITQEHEWWFMDDAKRVFPVFEYAIERNIKHIGTHKLIGHTGPETPFMGVEDFIGAAEAFPEAYFHIVHAGWKLMDETVEIMNRYENITAVLEGPMFWPRLDRQQFDKLITDFITRVDIDRVIYATGAALLHPYWILNDFLDYQPPSDSGVTITNEMKAKILGKNFANLHGLDIAAQKKKLENDKFAQIRKEDGLREPFINQRIEKPQSGLQEQVVPWTGGKTY